MDISKLKNIILSENLQKYAKIYFDVIYYGGENCLSIKKISENTFHLCILGERGKIIFDSNNLSEEEACKIALEYLTDFKFLYESDINTKTL